MHRHLRFWFALLLSVLCTAPAFAWPDKPVRIVVGFQAGGSTDVVARIIADKLRSQFAGASFVVENKPGANGQIAAGVVLNAHDNHTLLLMGDGAVISPLISKSQKDTIPDLKLISTLCEGTVVVLAPPSSPFKDFAGFVAYARANPNKISYVSSGIGNPQHLVGEYLAGELKLDIVHVPSRGGGQAVTELVGGQMQLGILGLGPTLPHIKSGNLRALAVTVDKRMPQLPDVPTLAELGVKDFTVSQWYGLAAPKDMPDAIVAQLATAVATALDDPAIRQRFDEVGFAARASTPAAFNDKVRAESAKWKRLIDARGLKVD
ncbi:MAG: tripartite tricarboxylate transporter substrate binding protein [Proteobacteria bacterium]|nr:tripartite tricarboxylate transporter substrate binding protein [Pseudomonadota bacterium]